MSDKPEDESNYDLVMPFLPVQSKGGPHDDDAFTAGYEMGLLDATLGRFMISPYENGQPIRAENAQQADLIAMRHGWRAEFTDQEVPGWVCMTLRRSVEVPES
ncbi:hypothetical protein [Mycobacterium gordonae]|uniref:Uncharacterized protein n=1 Tax=Mycobacterium gordonae TaxID=1778 RepID=A0A1X1WPF9_MYCGO|nr:hypothetical protein [Mycobacterium gordonae]MCV7004591.1 hypothetical protein [Mycobacterium gordonae]ODR16598.1 hypothetical protein BHQ23_29295 [Mycobacterium gordonae]ORV88515.1 hypothetical protein AWC08_22255 [Mycobacterium gordonae]